MGLNEPTFSNMVSGRRGISEELRKEIAKYTGIDLERILVNNGFISQRGGDKNLSTTNQSGGVNLNAEDATGNKWFYLEMLFHCQGRKRTDIRQQRL